MIWNQSLFHLKILCYLYLKALSIHDFKSVMCSISGYYVIYIFRRFQFMILNQYCLFHLRILCYLYFYAFSLHNFKSVVVPPQDTMLFIFKGVVNSWLEISDVCSILVNYSISIFQAFSIHDFKSVLFVPSQDTMLFIFKGVFNSWF